MSRYHNDDSQASDPGGIRLSLAHFHRLEPMAQGVRGWFWRSMGGGIQFAEMLDEHLQLGDSRAACVIAVEPLLVAASTICCNQGSVTWLFRPSCAEPVLTVDRVRGLAVGVQGEHGRVLLPPSRDQKGREYRWRVSPNHASLAPAPGWLTDWIGQQPSLIATSTVSPSSVANVASLAASKHEDAVLMQGKPLLSASS